MSYVVFVSLCILLFLLIKNKIRASFLFFGLLLFYYFFDLIKLDKMLHGFVNPSLITLLLLLIVSIVFEKTSFIQTISNKLFSASYIKSLLKMSLFTSLFSAFLNNTAVVASMISVVNQNKFHAPSRLLLPLSYAAIFGGTITLIGTSTNLLINSFMIENGLTPLKLFDFIYVGLPIALIGAGVLVVISRFLPNIQVDKIKENYFLEAKVLADSKLIGQTVLQNNLRNLEYLFLSEIYREGKVISPVEPSEILNENDILLFSGDVKHIEILKQFSGLELIHQQHNLSDNIIEVILSNDSTMINKTIKESNFRSKFNASVIAIKRGNEKLSGKISDIKLHVGDNLVLAIGQDFMKRDNINKNFYFTNQIGIEKRLSKKESYIVLGGFFSVLFVSFIGILPLIKGLFILLVLFIIFGFITISEIKRRFPFELMIIIGSALGIATVMIQSGLAQSLAEGLNFIFGGYGVFGAFVSIYLFTFLLTEIITNNAAAALSFPIAYSTALAFDSSLLPFIMAVVYGASASFLMPYGYQTNLMVYSIGGYDMKVFLKSGAIVSVVYSLLVIGLVPLFFPF
ncbi:MAG: SLC13 family permease [Candidatus Marinarcus sp.]|uniref:SLC13 family permease n=1 Tax=Candidatus Marinarcus sp. TaxID=3100987 RepID=UPI003AFFCCEE